MVRRGVAVLSVLLVAATILSLSPPSAAKVPREWRIVFSDTRYTVLVTDPAEVSRFFNETHYQITGGTRVTDDPDRTITAEIYGDPCNAPYDCEHLWYRYFGPVPGKVAYMNYYLTDGTLYWSWTRPGLQEHMSAFRFGMPPSADGGGSGGGHSSG